MSLSTPEPGNIQEMDGAPRLEQKDKEEKLKRKER